jgi:hypothetical protein
MRSYDPRVLDQFRRRLEQRLAALVQQSTRYQPPPFLLIDMRGGWFQCDYVAPSAGSEWRRESVMLNRVYVGSQQTNLDRFRLGLILKQKRWWPADANTLVRDQPDKYKTSVLARLQGASAGDALTHLGTLFLLIAQSIEKEYGKVVFLIDDESQRLVLSSVIPACLEGKIDDGRESAWQRPIFLNWAKSDDDGVEGFALFPIQLLLNTQAAEAVLLNTSSGDGTKAEYALYRWDGEHISRTSKPANAKLDLATLTTVGYVGPKTGFDSSGNLLVFPDKDSLQAEGTARRVLYHLYRAPLRRKALDAKTAMLKQQNADLRQSVEKSKTLIGRAEAILERLAVLDYNRRP